MERLLSSQHAVRPIPDEKLDEVARRIGVQTDLLAEVRARARIERITGESTARFPAGKRVKTYELYFPNLIYEAWCEECRFRGVEGATLLRSIIHEFLLSDRDLAPEERVHLWYWKGRRYILPQNDPKKYRLSMNIPYGAYRALQLRARKMKTSVAVLARTFVFEAMAGKHPTIPLIEPRVMYDDENRYLRGRLDPRKGAR